MDTQIYNGRSQILSMVIENHHFLDSFNFLPTSLKSMPKSFDITCKKGYYPHYLNTVKKLDYLVPYPETKLHGADYMSDDERGQYL